MRARLSVVLFALSLMLCIASASAQQLTLSVDSSLSGAIRILPGEASESLRLTISRAGSVDATDFLTGWQASLLLSADDDAFGSLAFNTASELESSYVFDSIGSLGPSAVISDAELFAFDTHFPFSGGANISPGIVANLLEFEVIASANARGRFGLYAIPGPGNSEWSDASEPLFLRREFANVRDSGGIARLADILVAHPGDFDIDDDVDGTDFLLWQRGESFTSLNRQDLQDWSKDFGFNSCPTSTLAAIITLPEPGSLVLFGFAFGWIALPDRSTMHS